MTLARSPSHELGRVIEEMQAGIAKQCVYFYNPALAETRVTVYPKDVGENLNHLDPLKPRFGIEIEIRQPMPKDITP